MDIPPLSPTNGLAGVLATLDVEGRPAPPVHLWRPEHCGTIDIRVARDGVWFHEGSPIGREALVRLFASVLRLDPDGYHLVTPVEKLRIEVEDVPFLAVRVDRIDERLRFVTNVGDVVWAGPEHAIEVGRGPTGEPAPYLHVRRGLKARLTRPVFYELADLAGTGSDGGAPGVESDGAWFPLA